LAIGFGIFYNMLIDIADDFLLPKCTGCPPRRIDYILPFAESNPSFGGLTACRLPLAAGCWLLLSGS